MNQPDLTQAVIDADHERFGQALWLAHCEMGPEPPCALRPKEHRNYVKRLKKAAREILQRIN